MLERFNEFCQEAGLDNNVSPWRQERRTGKPYGRFTITIESKGQWFSGFVGLEFTAEIIFDKNDQGKRRVKQVVPVIVSGKYVNRGLPIPGDFIAMV